MKKTRENGNGYRVNVYRAFSPNFFINSLCENPGKSGEKSRNLKSGENPKKFGEIFAVRGNPGKSGEIRENTPYTFTTYTFPFSRYYLLGHEKEP